MPSLLIVAVGLLASDQTDAAKWWQQYYAKTAATYEVAREQDGERQALKSGAKPAMHWISIDDYNGAVFVWTHDGRPELVGTLFSSPQNEGVRQRQVFHEFASFSHAKLDVAGPVGKAWRPSPIEKLQQVPQSPAPVKSARLRKLQCREIARGFSAHMNRLGERWELRLLSRPLVEYRGDSDRILGGGLFAFVAYNTDPDILLLIEAQQTPNGARWFFQALRFSDKSLYLHYKGKLAWKSLRTRHGTNEPDTPDPQYRILGVESVMHGNE